MKSFKNTCGEISVSFTVGTYDYAIPNLKKLEKIDKHNNRKYYVSYRKELDLSLSKHNILIKGTNNLVDYFEKICNDKQKNIAMEIILQIGDVKDWENIPLEDRKKMADVFLNGTAIINSRGLKVAHSILHLDESTPHCHLIVIPVAKGFKTGMEKQVSTRQILDKTGLAMLRGLLFKELLKKFNKVFDCNRTLKKGSELTEHLSMKDYKKYMTEALVCETI